MSDAAAPTTTPREDRATASDAVVEAVGRASEALEYVERARGHLYALHQLTGRADFLFEEAAELFRSAGQPAVAEALMSDLVGRNVLDGRWTFQVVDEYDDCYYRPVVTAVRDLEARFQDGQRHVFEARMKERRRTRGAPGHEHRPPAADTETVETDPTA